MGASSFYDNKRITTTRAMKNYIKAINKGMLANIEEDRIDKEEEQREKVMLGLRTLKGIEFSDIDKLEKIKKYLDIQGRNIIIKKEYLFLSNFIILEILESME